MSRILKGSLPSPLIEARHILLAVASDDKAARPKIRALAQQLSDHLAGHPDEFAALAKTAFCLSVTGNMAAIWVSFPAAARVSEFERAISAMQPGEISAVPVESRFGFSHHRA